MRSGLLVPDRLSLSLVCDNIPVLTESSTVVHYKSRKRELKAKLMNEVV